LRFPHQMRPAGSHIEHNNAGQRVDRSADGQYRRGDQLHSHSHDVISLRCRRGHVAPLVQGFDVAHAPRLVENSGLRAVEAEHDEPALIMLSLKAFQRADRQLMARLWPDGTCGPLSIRSPMCIVWKR
jgi:hypothetical protein